MLIRKLTLGVSIGVVALAFMGTPIQLGFDSGVFSPKHAAAKGKDKHKRKYKHGHGHKTKMKVKSSGGHSTYKYKYEYKETHKGVKIKYSSKGGPPPWAPAHGYRHKHARGSDGYRVPFDLSRGGCNGALIGTVLGGATGGVVGAQVGHGNTRTVAIIGGTIIGAIVGGSIGQSMDRQDQNCVGQALEHARDGQVITWNSPNRDKQYRLTPTDTYQREDGSYCREYNTTADVGGRREQVYGRACRQPDGSWQLGG